MFFNLKKKMNSEEIKKDDELEKEKLNAINKAIDKLLKRNEELEAEVRSLRTNNVDLGSIDLDDKVDVFIAWYNSNYIKSEKCRFRMEKEMRDFIEKIAVWYELRYPDYEINRIMPGSGQEVTDINEVMFQKNKYINSLFDEDSEVREVEWMDFYNTKAFIHSLPADQRYRFDKPRYSELLYLDDARKVKLYLTPNGVVESASNVSAFTGHVVQDEELVGMKLKEAIKLLRERGIILSDSSEICKEVRKIDRLKYLKKEMLSAVMYRIIERGGYRFGPRRGFLFAKEFKLDIDIPMKYGVDRSDPGLRLFMNEYLKAGGSKDLECYLGYFSRTSRKEKLDTVSIQELILTEPNNAATFYTPEEDDLHQRLVAALNALNNRNSEEKPKVKKL